MPDTDSSPQIKYAPIPRALAVLGIGRSTLYDRVGSGDLRMIKVGGRSLVDMEKALAWLESCPEAKIGARRTAA
jgi:predicted DNA-binding transcriptional regulator AlpA